MATLIGVQSRVTIFVDKFIEQLTAASAVPSLDRAMKPIQYSRTDKPEFTVDGYDLPAFTLRWQGLAQPANYLAWRSDKGRLEITYSTKRTDEIRDGESYLEAMRQITTLMLYRKKQYFGIESQNPLLGIPGADPRNPHVIQLIDQYDIRIL